MKFLVVLFILILVIFKCKEARTSIRNVPIKYTTLDYVRMHGYPAESHYLTTSDGYIINLHRIPQEKKSISNGKIVLMEHGILLSSAHWILTGPGKGLGYILADEGYDVWMANGRGNEYSRNHTTLNPNADNQFWDFSWHEIAVYDLPASIDYILEQTNRNELYYVGYSQGATILYVLLSMKPEYNAKIRAYALMGPAVFMNHARSPFYRAFVPFLGILEAFQSKTGGAELLSSNAVVPHLSTMVCGKGFIGSFLCENVYYVIFGYSPDQTNQTLVPTMSLHMPAGSSLKQYIHYLQEVISGNFRQYDYGPMGNLKKYGRTTPPDYDLSKTTIPGYLIYSGNDLLIDNVFDVPRLHKALKNSTQTYFVPVPSFSHQDYVTGISAPSAVYPAIIKFFATFLN